MEQQQEQGWSPSDQRICSVCVTDYALKAAVALQETTDVGPCMTCGKEPSAPFDALLEVFVDGIKFLYDDALNSVSYVSSEGGYVGAATWDTWDLLEDFHDCFEEDASPTIIDELRAQMELGDWVDRSDPDFDPEVLLDAAWVEFCRAIKHETRYVFWLEPKGGEGTKKEPAPWEIDPATALDHVGDIIDDFGLFKDYEQGHQFYRARTYPGDAEAPSTAKRLGTPSASLSLQGNRMSPAGIPMFYAGESLNLVLDEVSVRTENRNASVGTFIATEPFRVVDLTAIPSMPSPFDQGKRHLSWKVSFLRSFVNRISEPIAKGRDQVDYVPTQVMTEYLLRIRWGRDQIQGIRYPSAAHEDGASVVLNVDSMDCLESGEEKKPGRLQMELAAHELFAAKLTWSPSKDAEADEDAEL